MTPSSVLDHPNTEQGLFLTAGINRRNAHGTLVRLPSGASAARKLTELLSHDPDDGIPHEGWWSLNQWRNDHRRKQGWCGASGIALDVDYHDAGGIHSAPPARTRELTGNIIHQTPRGLRVVLVFDRVERSRDKMKAAMRGAAAIVEEDLDAQGLLAVFPKAFSPHAGYAVDTSASFDLARLFWAPTTIVDGALRSDPLVLIRDEPFTVAELAVRAGAWRR